MNREVRIRAPLLDDEIILVISSNDDDAAPAILQQVYFALHSLGGVRLQNRAQKMAVTLVTHPPMQMDDLIETVVRTTQGFTLVDGEKPDTWFAYAIESPTEATRSTEEDLKQLLATLQKKKLELQMGVPDAEGTVH